MYGQRMNSPDASPTPAPTMPGPTIFQVWVGGSGRSRTCGAGRFLVGRANVPWSLDVVCAIRLLTSSGPLFVRTLSKTADNGDPTQVAGRLHGMGGVTVLVASYAGAASAPAHLRLTGLLDKLPGEKLVRRDAVVFADPGEAVAAAKALREAAAGVPAGELLRIAVHTGLAQGPAVRHAEQLLEIAEPGQTLLTATVAVASDAVDRGIHRLKDLGSPERIFELTSTTGRLRSLDQVPNNLPVMFTSFVGRQTQLAALRTQLSGNRLVTLIGPGGSGKTRLAAQVAAQLVERWPDGVWWVDLATVTDSAQIPEAVAAAVGVMVEAGDRLLIGQLRARRMLLCLDNCEQIIDGVAEFVLAVQSSCPEVSIFATSREPLALPAEAVWRVPALAPDEAIALFTERAGTELPESEKAIRSICVRLDGMPLALELAAAWVRTLTPEQIDAGLDDRFGMLTRHTRGVAARQQTLAASIDWSHDLLDEDERRVFRRLAVFAGGFTLDAARAVCDTNGVLEVFARLVDKSLVVAEDGRYRLLETIREYAVRRLEEAGEVELARDLHLDHYLVVESPGNRLRGHRLPAARDRACARRPDVASGPFAVRLCDRRRHRRPLRVRRGGTRAGARDRAARRPATFALPRLDCRRQVLHRLPGSLGGGCGGATAGRGDRGRSRSECQHRPAMRPAGALGSARRVAA